MTFTLFKVAGLLPSDVGKLTVRQLRLLGNEGKDPNRQVFPVFSGPGAMARFREWKAQFDAEKRAKSIEEGTYGDRR